MAEHDAYCEISTFARKFCSDQKFTFTHHDWGFLKQQDHIPSICLCGIRRAGSESSEGERQQAQINFARLCGNNSLGIPIQGRSEWLASRDYYEGQDRVIHVDFRNRRRL